MKKIDYRIILSAVVLLGAFLLIFLGVKNKYCLGFGFILLAGALGLFAYFNVNNIGKTLKATDADLNEYYLNNKNTNEALTNDIFDEMRRLKKTKRSMIVSFSICCVLLVVCGIAFMI